MNNIIGCVLSKAHENLFLIRDLAKTGWRELLVVISLFFNLLGLTLPLCRLNTMDRRVMVRTEDEGQCMANGASLVCRDKF